MFLIEDVVDANIYRHNGFRLLDLPITASGKKVKKSFRKIDALNKMSKNDEIIFKKDSLLPITPSPKFKDYQEADNRLNDAKIRFIDEVFWFWPSSLIKDSDNEAWEYLKNKQYEEFISYWENLNDKNVSNHNLAVFYQVISLDLYVLGDNKRKQLDYSKKALKYWNKTLSTSSGFKDFAKGRVRKLNNPMLKESFVDETFQALPKALLSIYLDMAQDAIKSNNLTDAEDIINLINKSGFDKVTINSTINNLLTFIIYKIDSEKREYQLSTEGTKEKDYLNHIINAKSYTVSIIPLLNILSIIAPNNIKAKNTIDSANGIVQNQLSHIYNALLDDYIISNELNLLFVSLITSISIYYTNFDLSFNKKNIINNNFKIFKNRINYLQIKVYSSSDKYMIDLMVNFIENEFRKGSKIKHILKNFEEVKYSGASEKLINAGIEMLSNSFINCIQGFDRVTQLLHRQNLNMFKYEMLLES